jgi:hypothetical protein
MALNETRLLPTLNSLLQILRHSLILRRHSISSQARDPHQHSQRSRELLFVLESRRAWCGLAGLKAEGVVADEEAPEAALPDEGVLGVFL